MSKRTSGSSTTGLAAAPAASGSLSAKQDPTRVIQTIYLGILEAIEAGGTGGAPGGIIYAALQQAGASLDQYHQFMHSITGRGFATLDGERYRLTAAGLAFIPILRRKLGLDDAAQDAGGHAGDTR